ncbi:hypothetical protein T484DRAFT_3126915 [Baffinella frigidus]|nr:hypothetical protein T484DRAFT_3126915 [Cryptophyta sp. CCMP2293]
MLLNQVVGALKVKIRSDDVTVSELIADMKNDLQMLAGVKEGCANLEKWTRKKRLKEKGLNNILKDLHSKVGDQSRAVKILSQESKELIAALNTKSNDLSLLEEQMCDFVGEIQYKETSIKEEKEHVQWLEQDAREKQSLMDQLERRNLALEEEGEALRDQLRGGKGRSRMDERYEEMREVNANLKEDLERMKQENNTQRLQMQRMQSQLRNTLSAQNAGGGGDDNEERSHLLQTQVEAKEREVDLLLELLKSGEAGVEQEHVDAVCQAIHEAEEASRAVSSGGHDGRGAHALEGAMSRISFEQEELRKELEAKEAERAALLAEVHHLRSNAGHRGEADPGGRGRGRGREGGEESKEAAARVAEERAREERGRARLADKNKELEDKVEHLMKQIQTLVERRAAEASEDEVTQIQAASEARMEEYLDTRDDVRDDFVGEMIYRYEEERVLLQRQFLQQLHETI